MLKSRIWKANWRDVRKPEGDYRFSLNPAAAGSASGRRAKMLLVTLILLSVSSQIGRAQELNVRVQIDKSRLSGTSLNYLDTFGAKAETYLNEYNWTDSHFNEHERINVSIRIILLSMSDDYNFEANLIINSYRPIYNSHRQTSLFLFNDESWNFNYAPNQGLIHGGLRFSSITTLLDFYAYVILGYDFDSFSELGGSPWFNRAQSLTALARSGSASGWGSAGSSRRNARMQLIADLMNPNFTGFRKAMYLYHRHGLDRFPDNPDEARQQVFTALELIEETAQKATSNLLFNTFFNTKYREITSIFEDAPADLRLKAYQLLSRIDPAHLSEYDKLR